MKDIFLAFFGLILFLSSGIAADKNIQTQKVSLNGEGDIAVTGLHAQMPKIFRIDDENYDIAELNILRARDHTWVYVNGQLAGENQYNFAASAFDIRKYLKKNAEYELIAEIMADGKRIQSFRQIGIKNLKENIK